MQGVATKQDRTRVKKCPRCHAENLIEQSKCGKCGYVFPKSEAHVKKNKVQGVPFDLGSNQQQENEFGATNQDQIEEEEEVQLPKAIPKTAKSEGPLTTRGAWTKCSRCQGDLKWDARRCPKCGNKP